MPGTLSVFQNTTMPVTKVEMSLDEIIKENKKKEQKEKTDGKRGPAGNKRGAIRRRPGGVAKKQGTSPQKKGVRGRGPVRAQQGGSRQLASKFRSTQKPAATQATKQLVQKLVKKALRTSLVARAQPVVRNVIRRGGARIPRKITALNRLSAKSRVIARRQPIAAPVIRGRGQVRYQRNPPAIIRRRTIIRPVQVVEQPVRRFNRKPARQQFVQQNSIRSQLMALRQQQQGRQRVVYVQQPPQPRQQVVYVQQQPRRRQQQQRVFVQRRTQQQPQFFRNQQQPRRNNRFRGNNNNSDPFFTPPNYLQRV